MRWGSALRGVGVVLLVWIGWQVDWSNMWEIFFQINLYYLVGYVFFYIFYIIVRAYRLSYLVKSFHVKIHILLSLNILAETNWAGQITPGKVGEVVKLPLLKKEGVSIFQGIIVSINDRIFDTFFLLLFGAIGLIYFFHISTVIISMFLVFFILGLIISWYLRARIKQYLDRVLQKRIDKMKLKNAHNIVSEYKQNFLSTFKINILLSIIILCLNFFHIMFLGKAFFSHITVMPIILAFSVATCVAMLPVSFNGLGTREAIYVALLAMYHIPTTAALAFSIFDGIFFSYLSLVMILVISNLLLRILLNKTKRTNVCKS